MSEKAAEISQQQWLVSRDTESIEQHSATRLQLVTAQKLQGTIPLAYSEHIGKATSPPISAKRKRQAGGKWNR